MREGESGRYFDEIHEVVPQFEQFPRDHVDLIKHFLGDLLAVAGFVALEETVLPGAAAGEVGLLLEESQLAGVD